MTFKPKNNITPKGELFFARPEKPDDYGNIGVTLVLPTPVAEKFLAEWKETIKDRGFVKHAKLNVPELKPHLDKDKNEVPGFMRLDFKTNASFISKETGEEVKKSLKVCGPSGQPFPAGEAPPYIPNGTVGQILFNARSYGEGQGSKVTKPMGVKLDPIAIKIPKITVSSSYFPADEGYEDEEAEQPDWEPQEKPKKSTKTTSVDDLNDVLPF